MTTISQNISKKFHDNGSVFFFDDGIEEHSIVEMCDELCISKDKEDNSTVFHFEDDSQMLICESFWTNKPNEIEEFFNFNQNYRSDSFSMESLDLSWENFL